MQRTKKLINRFNACHTKHNMYKKIAILFYLSLFTITVQSQEVIKLGGNTDSSNTDFSVPKEYIVKGVTFTGAEHYDQGVLTLLTGLAQGDKVMVPGEKFSTAISSLWKQGLFEDVKVTGKVVGEDIFINFAVVERPRLSKFSTKGMTKSESDDLREKIKLYRGVVVTDRLLSSVTSKTRDFFVNKGYMNVKVDIKKEKVEKFDNLVILVINVTKGNLIRIKDINLIGTTSIPMWKLRRTFKETKRRFWWNPFNSGKFDEDNYEKDKKALIAKYNEHGYRDAKIVKDSVYRLERIKVKRHIENYRIVKETVNATKRVSIDITVSEGNKYYFRNVNWVGNSKYTTKTLNDVFGIKKGDVYDQSQLDQKLFSNPNGNDISSLYMDE